MTVDGGTRGLWRTPEGVWKAPLKLLGRTAYDLDAASDWGADVTVPAARRLVPADDALANRWFAAPLPAGAALRDCPLVWLNPPFGSNWGGKRAWVGAARRHAQEGAIVAFYCPAYGDTWADRLEAEALTTIRVGGGRVRHVPPSGVKASSPGPAAHRIWMLGPHHIHADWPYRARLVWDHRSEQWIRPAHAAPWFPARSRPGRNTAGERSEE